MSQPASPSADAPAVPDLGPVVELLLGAPGMGHFPDLFPRLSARHLDFLADPARTPRPNAAALLTAAGRGKPVDLADAARQYRERGELPALRLVETAEVVARAAADMQREVDQLLGQVEGLAVLCDREGVRCSQELTWGKRLHRLRAALTGEHADSPAAQKQLIGRCRDEMDAALEGEKQRLLARLAAAEAQLDRDRDALEEETARRAKEYADSARALIAKNDMVIGIRKLAAMEALLSGRVVKTADADEGRLPLPTRRNPFGRAGFSFEGLLDAARAGAHELARRGLTEYMPNQDFIDEATNPQGFLVRHAARGGDPGAYFAALEDWLALREVTARAGEPRKKRRRRLPRPNMPNLEARGSDMPGRWVFMTAEAWDGAPYYEDVAGRPRIIALLRPWVRAGDRISPEIILRLVGSALQELFDLVPETEEERQFRQDGLVVVMLPGAPLAEKKYDQFRLQVQFGKAVRWRQRVAYLDDLDVLRLLPLQADDRFRGLLELVLPRFPDALNQTYQESDAVRPRMFFGRNDELARLENGATVVFSGRKMGKSSLLRRLNDQCGADTDQRAILVGCSGVVAGRSWMILSDIERELAALARELLGAQAVPVPPRYGPVEDFQTELDGAKARFRQTLDGVLSQLAARGVNRLYVLLDEADNFIRAEMEETSGGGRERSAVSWFLRDLQTGPYLGRLRFVFAGYDQIGRVFRDPGLGHSAFANWGTGGPLKLGPLDEGAARALVVRPLTALGMLVPDDLAERILDYTSGHASLIQAFCRKLAERVGRAQNAWPLNDVAVEFEDVQAVADGQRGDGEQNYRQLLELTLGLNLDIARAYPLKLLFLALVSPNGLGAGRVLGFDPFTVDDALEQVRPTDPNQALDLTPTLVLDSLDLLAQLGLLEDVSETGPKQFRFKARHYVNVLRTKNGFRSQLQQVLDEWQRAGRRSAPVEPRYVWTLPDSALRSLRNHTGGPAVVVGLPGTGRGYLAEVLAAPRADYGEPIVLTAEQPDLRERFDALVGAPVRKPVIVSDSGDQIPWETASEMLQRGHKAGLSLRWLGGPRFAWSLAADADAVAVIDGPFGLGPLTASELEPWTARELGGTGAPTAATISDPDREQVLALTGGLLPVLELFRRWLVGTHGHFPDVLRGAEAEAYRTHLESNARDREKAAEKLAAGLPAELRAPLHKLFVESHLYGADDVARDSLPGLCGLPEGEVGRFLDAAGWLCLLPDARKPGRVRVPYASIPGVLIRDPRFAQ